MRIMAVPKNKADGGVPAMQIGGIQKQDKKTLNLNFIL